MPILYLILDVLIKPKNFFSFPSAVSSSVYTNRFQNRENVDRLSKRTFRTLPSRAIGARRDRASVHRNTN